MPDLFAHHPPLRSDGRLAVTITYLELARAGWTPRSAAPALDIEIARERAPAVAFYRDLYDRIGRPWLWYERRLMADQALAFLLAHPRHELHVARHEGALVGYFELDGSVGDGLDLAFFGLGLPYIGRRIGPWLLDRAIERAFAAGAVRLTVNTNTLDHPGALHTYRKAGFRAVRSETKELRDPRVRWPDLYRWPPA